MSLIESGQSSTVEIGDQPVGVRGDPHHPLLERPLVDREVAALAPAVGGDLFVGEHGAETRTPIDGRLGDVGEPVRVDQRALLRRGRARRTGCRRASAASRLELAHELGDRAGAIGFVVVPRVVDLEEDPLRPPVVVDVGRGRAAARIVTEAERAHLALHRWRCSASVVTRGWVPVCTANCSAGSPNAS